MLTRILLPALLLFCLGMKAQTDIFNIQSPAWQPCCQDKYTFYTFKPANSKEKKILAKADSLLFAFLKHYKDTAKNYEYKQLWGWQESRPVDYKEIEKYLTQKPLEEHALLAYWNETFDTLYGWAIAPVFTMSIGKTTGKGLPVYLPLFEYGNFMTAADYKAYRDLFITQTKKYLGVVHDTLIDRDITMHQIKLDTNVLPHLNFESFIRYKIFDAIQEGSVDVYTDLTYKTLITKEEVGMIQNKPADDPADNKLASIFIVNEWQFDTATNLTHFTKQQYGYAFFATRKKTALAFGGKVKPGAYIKYNEIKSHILKHNRAEVFAPFEQALEAVFFKKCNIELFNN